MKSGYDVNEDEEKKGLIILLQEFSRRSLSWKIIHICNLTIDIPILNEILEESDLVLAGGALTSTFYHKKISDFDIFMLSNKLDFIRNFKHKNITDIFESSNAITILTDLIVYNQRKTSPLKIQIIKRVYNTIDQIVGGFDLEHCKLFWKEGKIYGTVGAHHALDTNLLIINTNSGSTSFISRIVKYSRKYDLDVFFPHLDMVFPLAKMNHRYQDSDYIYTYDYMRYNLSQFMFKNNCEFIYKNNKIFTIEEFIKKARSKRLTIDMNVLKKNFHKYEKGPQKYPMTGNNYEIFTSSFKPLELNLRTFYHKLLPNIKLRKANFITDSLMTFFIILRRVPKYLRFHIMKYAIENELAKIIYPYGDSFNLFVKNWRK